MLGKLSLMAAALVVCCAVVGCKGEDPAPAPTNEPAKSGPGKGGNSVSTAQTPGLNPNYHGSAADDDKKVGSALNGK